MPGARRPLHAVPWLAGVYVACAVVCQNAYTAFDETVYFLRVPIDKPGLLEKGLEATPSKVPIRCDSPACAPGLAGPNLLLRDYRGGPPPGLCRECVAHICTSAPGLAPLRWLSRTRSCIVANCRYCTSLPSTCLSPTLRFACDASAHIYADARAYTHAHIRKPAHARTRTHAQTRTGTHIRLQPSARAHT
jgi:hypothetical protein